MKNNKLLAEYLELDVEEVNGKLVCEEDAGQCYYFNPDEDWNYLMMVVNKVAENEGDYFNIQICELHNSGLFRCKLTYKPYLAEGKTTIESVYNACVEYIKSKKL